MSTSNSLKIITADQVIDGSGAPPIKNAVIVVKGDEIEAVVRDRSLVNFNNMAVEEFN
jgi:hypothetical protein